MTVSDVGSTYAPTKWTLTYAHPLSLDFDGQIEMLEWAKADDGICVIVIPAPQGRVYPWCGG